jgi:hypothetical protein
MAFEQSLLREDLCMVHQKVKVARSLGYGKFDEDKEYEILDINEGFFSNSKGFEPHRPAGKEYLLKDDDGNELYVHSSDCKLVG